MSESAFENGFALLIGVGADLQITIKDATALKALLTDPGRAAYPDSHVTFLVEAKANRDAILSGLDELAGKIKNRDDATVLVYYSGHGGRRSVQGANPEYYLVPYGYDPQDLEHTAVSGAEFTAKIAALHARKLVVLLDCCHAGGVPVSKTIGESFIKAPVPPELFAALAAGSGRIIVASSRESEYSYIGSSYSVFTDCLLDALAGKASLEADGFARILDVLSFLFREVPKRATQGPQHPFVNSVEGLSDNFPLCFYSGGDKSLPAGVTPVKPPAPVSPSLAKLELDGLLEAAELQIKKLNALRKAWAIETDPAQLFKLEQQMLELEADLASNRARIAKLEGA